MAVDADTFIDASAAILADYPDDVIVTVTDPRTGIAGRQKWRAQPSEVKEACERIMAPRRRQIEREESIRKQLEERVEFEAMTAPKQTYQEFKAEMSARGLPIDGKKPFIADTVDELKERYGLTDDQWDAIPNGPGEGDWDRMVATHRR